LISSREHLISTGPAATSIGVSLPSVLCAVPGILLLKQAGHDDSSPTVG
jgi:hypothetical protein